MLESLKPALKTAFNKNKIRVSYEGTKGENFRNKYPFDNSYDK